MNESINPILNLQLSSLLTQNVYPTLLNSTLPPDLFNKDNFLNLLVQTNPKDALASVLLNGFKIEAKLPEMLSAGDKIIAQVLDVKEQVHLKIIQASNISGETLEPFTDSSTITLNPNTAVKTTKTNLIEKLFQTMLENSPTKPQNINTQQLIVQKIQELLDNPIFNPVFTSLKSYSGVELPLIELKTHQNSEPLHSEPLKKLVSLFPNAEELSNSENVLTHLKNQMMSSPNLVLKEITESIKQQLVQSEQAKELKFLTYLKDQLFIFLETESLDSLKHITQAIEQELSTPDKPNTTRKSKDLLRTLLQELKEASQEKEFLQEKIASSMSQIEQFLGQHQNISKAFDSKTLDSLSKLASHIDSLASAQENLNTLAPILKVADEPILILFPYIFQNILSHAEVHIGKEAYPNQKTKRKNKDKDSGEGKTKGHSAPYHRISISLPLPSLGQIQLELAYRMKEIIIQIASADEMVCLFLLEQKETLTALLHAHNYELKDYNVTKKKVNKKTNTNTKPDRLRLPVIA